jgi:hypothetical protein
MSLRDNYKGGLCPDCGDAIPEEAEDGEECENCGHVFCHPRSTAENTNCLEGIKCPKCESHQPFDISARTTVMMFDDGSDPEDSHGDLEWDNDSFCRCASCNHTGKVSDFRADQKPPEDKPTTQPAPEVWYCWRERLYVEGEATPRLLVPWADPQQYEFPFDFIYKTPEKAIAGLHNMADAPEVSDPEDPHETDAWVLCKMTLEPVPRPK